MSAYCVVVDFANTRISEYLCENEKFHELILFCSKSPYTVFSALKNMGREFLGTFLLNFIMIVWLVDDQIMTVLSAYTLVGCVGKVVDIAMDCQTCIRSLVCCVTDSCRSFKIRHFLLAINVIFGV